MREYRRLLRFVKPHAGLFACAVICMIFSTLFDGISLGMIVPLADKVLTNKAIIVPAKLPAFLSDLIARINATPPLVLLHSMVAVILFMFLLKGLFEFLQSYLMSDVGQKVVRDIRTSLYKKMQELSLDYFTHKRGGELISRITNDVKLVENAVSYGATDLVYQSLQVALFTSLIFFIHPRLALLAFIMLPLISFPILKIGKALRKFSTKTQERMADINSVLYENIIGVRVVKSFNMEHYEIKKFNLANYDYYRFTMKAIKRTLLIGPFTEILGCVAGLLVFVIAGKDVIAGKLSFGIFGLFLGSLFSLIRPFKKLSQVNSINQQAMAASVRIHEILDKVPSVFEKPNATRLESFSHAIVFDNVSFGYNGQAVLANIHLEVKKGEVVAIVGPSGAGKTTLVDLLSRFYDPQGGKIVIDGKDIRDLTLVSLREHIGIVTQETILFNDSIKANIAYGNTDASAQEIERAAAQAYAHDFIKRLPRGYETFIGDRGIKLSGGERQRIAIARALLKNPPILVLDEATSQLDTESERIVQEALNRLMQGRTVLMIAHRLSTVKNAHRIIVVAEGKIIEDGSHEELLRKDGLYRKLCQCQEL